MSAKSTLNLLRLYIYSKTRTDHFLPRNIYPIRSSLRPTNRCNSRCITCNYWKKDWQDKVSKDRWIEIIDHLNRMGVSRIRFTGGEPLMRKDFFEIVEATGNHPFEKVTLATNGLLLDKYSTEIKSSPLTDLGVSLDGMGKTNDRIRGVDGYFDQVVNTLPNIRNKTVTIMTTILSSNIGELNKLFEICEENGWKWDFNLPDNRLFFLEDMDEDIKSLWPSQDETNQFFDTLSAWRDSPVLSRVNDIQLKRARRYLLEGDVADETPCFLGYTDIDIDAKGNIYTGCYVLPPIGNILEQSLTTLLESDAYKERLLKMLRGECPGCACGYELNAAIKNLPSYALKRVLKRGYK